MKGTKIFTLDDDLIDKLSREPNASKLVNDLLRKHYNNSAPKVEELTEKLKKLETIKTKTEENIKAIEQQLKVIEEDEAKRKAQLSAIFENLPQEIKDVFNSFGPKLNEYSLRSQYDYFSEKYPKLKWEEVKKAYEEFKKINGAAADAVSNNENGAD